MTDITDHIDRLIGDNRLEEALDATADALAATPTDELYYRRGKILWRLGRHTEAMGAYAEAAAINPASPAAEAIRQARAIMDFTAPDLYNP